MLAELYDCELIIRFVIFGESRSFDYSRLTQLFPCRQVVPGGRRKSRRDEDGFVRYNPSVVGCVFDFGKMNVFGHVPVGSFVRKVINRLFTILKVDLLSCSPDVVSVVD